VVLLGTTTLSGTYFQQINKFKRYLNNQ
jgi:hypothetical protein